MTKLMTHCCEIATFKVNIYWMLLAFIVGFGLNVGVLTAQEVTRSVLEAVPNQDPILQSPTNPIVAPSQVDAPRPLEDSAPHQDDDVEILARGPLHEAFANVHQDNATPSPLIEQQPPEAIEELLPDYKPEGQNVQWITGYWGWDETSTQFIWISGLWRDAPPGQRWIPGYWEDVKPGFRWVYGFWTAAEVEELSYLPAPPDTLDLGPSSAAPSANHFYIPGCWVYQSQDYQWRPGFWQPYSENWVWIPARYVWTPCGFVYCAGFWDRMVEYRGVAFAPVRFARPVYLTPHYHYRPVCRVVTNAAIFAHLFVRPRCNNYYFGDWYGDQFARNDYRAWVDYGPRHGGYDPFFSYYGCSRTMFQNTLVIQWATNQNRICQSNMAFRPAHTFQNNNFAHGDHNHDNRGRQREGVAAVNLVDNFDQHVRTVRNEKASDPTTKQVKFQDLNEDAKKIAKKSGDPIRELQTLRRNEETARVSKKLLADATTKIDSSKDRTRPTKPVTKLALPKASDLSKNGISETNSPPIKGIPNAAAKRLEAKEQREIASDAKKQSDAEARRIRNETLQTERETRKATVLEKIDAAKANKNQATQNATKVPKGLPKQVLPNPIVETPKLISPKSQPTPGAPVTREPRIRNKQEERNANKGNNSQVQSPVPIIQPQNSTTPPVIRQKPVQQPKVEQPKKIDTQPRRQIQQPRKTEQAPPRLSPPPARERIQKPDSPNSSSKPNRNSGGSQGDKPKKKK